MQYHMTLAKVSLLQFSHHISSFIYPLCPPLLPFQSQVVTNEHTLSTFLSPSFKWVLISFFFFFFLSSSFFSFSDKDLLQHSSSNMVYGWNWLATHSNLNAAEHYQVNNQEEIDKTKKVEGEHEM